MASACFLTADYSPPTSFCQYSQSWRCEALAALLGPEKVLFRGSPAYDTTLSSYFALQASSVQPLCFVTPHTASDVSSVVQSLTADSAGGSCHFAIRSGGHMWVPGASNSPDGVTVDLANLNSIDVNTEALTVSVGPAATWDAVFAKLDPLGFSAVGGRVAGVGVGGLTLGGGLSHFGPRYGWTCDTVTAFEVVLADGSIIEANETHNKDLFRGLRGGSNNFGIVTRIDLKIFEQGPVWAATIYSPLSTIDDQIEIFAGLSAAENYDENASFITGFGYSQSRNLTVITNDLVYTKAVENPQYYKGFLDQPSIYSSSSLTNMTALSQQQASYLPPGVFRYLFATTTFVPTQEMLRAVYDAYVSSLEAVKDINGLTWTVSLEPLPPQIYQRGAADNALGLADRSGTRVVCLLSQAWSDQADSERATAASAALVGAIEKAARELGAHDPYIYLNYAANWQDPISTYGAESVKQLQELRAKVDPEGVFTRLVPGGFKVPN
ncbi:hypothetical protein KVR01_007343 [Diaporthe batatas]|uniref:uncharacterized protein n=1 Tax=Diaporthe batatas TaxID=748121 RepID=UPI001D045858|nr:uncharacterized protein KVR01_007343 [Diaporthe batatas]KAG8162865.1 hypothetical protein KVR01_007343 [Diaporthe batatas]